MELNFKQRRQVANALCEYDDSNLPIVIKEGQTDNELYEEVVSFFENGSELIYPSKYIFCNIVYSYYLAKYFGEDLKERLKDPNTLEDSPMYYTYVDNPKVYDRILEKVLPNIEQYDSIQKTLGYFYQEFLIEEKV